MCLLGCDIGSSSIKVSIVDEETGLTIGADFYPKEEAPIKALRPGWAEQNPRILLRPPRTQRLDRGLFFGIKIRTYC